jgi:hypothetical protein
MPQFGRPIADTINANHWLNDAASSVSIFGAIDEATTAATTADYIQSSAGLTSAIYVTKLTSNLEDPVSSAGHVIRYTFRKATSAGAQVNLTVELRQNYVSEASQGTTVWSTVHTNISSVQTTAAITLTALEADSITAYSSLSIRFVSNQV